MTPEGKIKRLIKNVLIAQSDIYYFMPVPAGYGESSLDYIGCYAGKFFAIEAKAPGKVPTKRQNQIISAMSRADGRIFVIDSDAGVEELKIWLQEVKRL